ncbi:MAG: hypothetical protein ACK56F_25020, partial [bacterium]
MSSRTHSGVRSVRSSSQSPRSAPSSGSVAASTDSGISRRDMPALRGAAVDAATDRLARWIGGSHGYPRQHQDATPHLRRPGACSRRPAACPGSGGPAGRRTPHHRGRTRV